VNKAANTIHSPEDGPTRDCYGWDLMLDGKEDGSNSDQDLVMPDDLHCKISDNTQKMMDQQFAHPTHTSVGEDFIGLEDTLNNVLRRLGDMVAFNPAAQGTKAPLPGHKEVALYDPILQAQTIETQRIAIKLLCQPTPPQSSMGSCLGGAQEGTECVTTMEVNKTNYRQPDVLIPNHPVVSNFLWSQGRTMNYRAAFTTMSSR
jgi:hypothetical protein